MTTLLTGTLERTVGWLHPGAEKAVRAEHHPVETPATARPVPLDLRVRQWLCAARRGHAFIMGIDGPRMYLICQHCFHETAGWQLTVRPRRFRD